MNNNVLEEYPVGISIEVSSRALKSVATANNLDAMHVPQVSVQVEAQFCLKVAVAAEELGLFAAFILRVLLKVAFVLVPFIATRTAKHVQSCNHILSVIYLRIHI